MASVKQMGFGGLLKAQDVLNAKKKGVAGVISKVRLNVPGINAPLVITFDTEVIKGVRDWPCNSKQAQKLAQLISDNTDEWIGYGVKLGIIDHSLRGFPPGFAVAKVFTPEQVAKTRKSKPTLVSEPRTGRADEGPAPDFSDIDEIPF